MVRGRSRSPKVGIFQAGSHRIVDTPTCAVHHPLINQVAAALKQAIRETRSEPYADRPHRGQVRAVQVVVERATQSAQVTLVTRDDRAAEAEPLLQAFQEMFAAEPLHSLWWNGQPERSNTILGPSWQRVLGPEAVCESIGGAQVFFPPGAFGQAHLALADRVVQEVHALASGADRIAEWYAGCGAIGLGLLAPGAAVAFNEQSPHAIEGLRLGIEALGPAAATRAEVFRGAAEEFPDLARGRGLAVVDPPRRGLDRALCDGLASRPPEQLVYVSCGLESLERDVDRLLEPGHLRLASLTPYALFPFTNHVETLARFASRAPSGSRVKTSARSSASAAGRPGRAAAGTRRSARIR